jgi:hypothetical protein
MDKSRRQIFMKIRNSIAYVNMWGLYLVMPTGALIRNVNGGGAYLAMSIVALSRNFNRGYI